MDHMSAILLTGFLNSSIYQFGKNYKEDVQVDSPFGTVASIAFCYL
jgi:hypothetical protein